LIAPDPTSAMGGWGQIFFACCVVLIVPIILIRNLKILKAQPDLNKSTVLGLNPNFQPAAGPGSDRQENIGFF